MRWSPMNFFAAPSALTLLMSAASLADDWPQWRGLNRDGAWNETGLLQSFPADGLKVRWRAPAGWGFSSPVVAQGRVFLADSELQKPRAKERLRCFDEVTGQTIWTHAYDVAYEDWAFDPAQEIGPVATPIVQNGKIYSLGRLGHLFCLDAGKGEVLWKKSLEQDFQIKFAPGTPSPLIDGDNLILFIGGKPEACVVALNKDTGKEIWKALDEKLTFSSPIVITSGGKRQLIVWTQDSVTSLDPATGALWWRERLLTNSDYAVSTPVFYKDRLLIGGMMFQMGPDKPAATVLWPDTKASSRRIFSHTSTALFQGDYLFSAKSTGELICVEAVTGKQVWESAKVTNLKNGASIHLTPSGDSVLLYTDKGELIRAHLTASGYEEISRTGVLEPTFPFGGRNVAWSAPAYANRHIFARNGRELVCASLEAKTISLFNGRNLDGFYTWLVDTHRNDPRGVFTVVNGMIRISGEGLGYLSTEQEFGDYHLTAEFKWGAQNHGERVGKARDSGIFLHSTGPDGNSHDGKGAFKAAIECNLFQGATGDFLLIRGTDADGSLLAPQLTAAVEAEHDADGWFTWKPGGKPQTVERWGRVNWSGKSREWKDVLDFRGAGDEEKPPGEWNRVECICDGGRITVKVNSTVVNEATDVLPRRGRILLQCEGSEVFFRKLELLPLERKPASLAMAREADAVTIRKPSGEPVLRYQLTPPPETKLSVASGCYFHPLTTPAGIVVTDVAPEDHRHHRGVFLAFVEMHGRKDADFWGWGEHAPVKGRQIVNTGITELPAAEEVAGFLARNEWRADGDAILVEELKASCRLQAPANVLDLDYTLTPDADLMLSQWAFSGFCVRMRKDGGAAIHGPDGPVKLPAPIHTKPDSDWPAAAWYACALTLADGTKAGVAVLNHSENPPTLWHNHPDIRMLNPCIVAPAALTLKAGQPLRLRYRVVTFDGDVPAALLNELASGWDKR